MTADCLFSQSAGLSDGASTIVPQLGGFFASTRKLLHGALTPGVGQVHNVPQFIRAALLRATKYTLWLFAELTAKCTLVDGMSDQHEGSRWGSDLASVKTACGAGWQVWHEVQETRTIPCGHMSFLIAIQLRSVAGIEFSGPITALWTEARATRASAVVRNRENGTYESIWLALAM